jgi:hypothetical protein
LGERLLCKQEVAGSIPAGSTSDIPWKLLLSDFCPFVPQRWISVLMEALWKPLF